MGVSRRTGPSKPFFDEWTQRNTAPVMSAKPVQRRRRGRHISAVIVLVIAGVVASVVLSGVSALADPSATVWYRLRMCESGNDYSIDTGNGHYGAYQFDLSTWRSVGGSGLPNRTSPAEQDARALILYRDRGWQPWQCASILGLRPDASAGSGRISDIPVPTSSSGHSLIRIPVFPGGSHWYRYGETSRDIKVFQDRMHARGFFPVGTGQYGPNTLRMVEQLQRLNGLEPNGYIGPNTWRLAWTGRYRTP